MTQFEECEKLTKIVTNYMELKGKELNTEDIDFLRNVINAAYLSGKVAYGTQMTEEMFPQGDNMTDKDYEEGDERYAL